MDPRALAATTGAVTLTALVGSAASKDAASDWYRALDKPPIQPPAVVFPIVWTALYATVAGASAAVLSAAGDDRRRAFARALGLNLGLNASWSWVFFKAHRVDAATGVAAALALSGTDLVRRAWPVDRRAAGALAAYAGWCGFATVLTAAIGRRNRAR